MVPTINIITMAVLLVVSLLLPIVGCLIVKRRTKVSIVSLFIGMAVFAVCFVIGTATSYLASLFIASPIDLTIVLTLVFSLRAGLVEEFGRFVAFKWMLKKRNKIGDSLMYGVGHGGMEVWLILTLSLASSLVLAFMANSGSMDTVIAAAPEQADALNASVAVLADSSPLYLSAGLLERIIAMTVHIALSVIVFCAVRQRKWRYLLLAIALHTLVDASTVLYTTGLIGVWAIEGVLAGIVAIVVVIAWRIARGYRPPLEAWEAAPPPPPSSPALSEPPM